MIVMNLVTGEITEVGCFAPTDTDIPFRILPEHEGYEITVKSPR